MNPIDKDDVQIIEWSDDGREWQEVVRYNRSINPSIPWVTLNAHKWWRCRPLVR